MSRRPDNVDQLELELRGERAAALGRTAQRMEQALDELRAFDASLAEREHIGRPDQLTRDELAEIAAERVWYYIVHRESLGWRRHEAAIRAYDIPYDIYIRMGPRRRRG